MDVRAQGLDRARTCVLAGGDDYELVFTAPTAHRERVAQAAAAADLRVTRVGRVVARTPGKPLVRVLDEQGLEAVGEWGGYDHFG
jgi:thiamine-monophosphate kinase